MRSGPLTRRPRRVAGIRGFALVGAAVVSAASVMSAAAAPDASRQQARSGAVRQAQVLEHDRTGVDAPAGLAFSPSSRSFYVIGARSGGGPAETDIVRLAPFELSPESDRAGEARIAAAVKDPVNVVFDARQARLLLLDDADRLLEVRSDASGDLDPRTLVRRDALRLDLRDPQGMAVDPASGAVYVLDASEPRLVRIEPAADGSFEAATVSEVDLRSSGVSAARGLAFDPSTGHLHLRSGPGLVELTTSGAQVATRDLSRLGLAKPAGMVFAPSGDRTDDPAALSVYVADSGGSQSPGQIVELSLAPAVEIQSDFTSSLVTTVDMGALSPPSPDAAGITYVPSTNRLVISDSEVEETVNGITHFAGANVWELNRTGLSLARTANISNVAPAVVPVTNEPSGAAFNPSNGHYYFAADDGKKVFDVNPGADGLLGTAGDTVTSFDTLGAGNSDPEGVTYDSFSGHLFVADGVNREIYEYTTSGTLVNQFDTAQFGVEDPEAVEFNSVSGTLFILSDRLNTTPPAPIIVETTTSGTLVRVIDASASGAFKPAGLAYAPASDGSAVKRFYIVDRGVDNNNDPNAVDGKLYELTTPPADPPANLPPTVDAGSDQSVALPASASLDGTVTDDGLPAPFTTIWTQVSGPSTVVFGSPNAEDTTAGVTVAGVYVVRLTANDGQFSASDDVTLSFTGSGSSNVFEVRVNANPDDAEEISDGTVQRGDGDLDMMTDTTGTGSPKVKVGMRFNGVAIPQGAPITSAYVQFTADEVDTAATTLTIKGQAADNPLTFSTNPFDLTTRPTTTADASWSPGSWLAVGDASLVQRTDNLAGIVQEIVDRPGWASGNSIVLFVTGAGERVAVAHNQIPASAALLHVEWGAGSGNAAPVITSNGGGASATLSPAENQAVVTDVDATDPDPDTLTYSISGGPDAARFAINDTNGVLTFVSAPDFEAPQDVGANNVYDVTVSVSDGNGGSDSQAIAAAVQNVNEFAPVIDGGASASVSVPENQTAATDVDATDGDGDVLTYSLTGGADIGDFTIDPSTGVLTFTVPPDFELPADANSDNFYEVTVTAADASFSDTQAVTVQVLDVVEGGNSPPTITSDGGGATASKSVAENQTAVTDVDATDPDPDALTYSISGGADAARFAIVPETGVLTFAVAPNFEAPTDVGGDNVYNVTVLVSDGNGGSDSQAIAVTVTNVNEFTPVITSDGGGDSAAVSRPENQTAVTDVDATDGDGQTITYSISGGPDAARFSIVPATGVLTFATAPNFEAPTDVGGNNVYDVTVQASDGTLADTQAIAVTVTDVSEPSGSPLYFSLADLATVGGVPAENEDILFFDGTSFSLAFDGSDVGITTFRIDAFSFLDPDSLLLSFDGPGTVPGISGTTDDSDVVRFDATSLGETTAGTFTLYFDASDVGLTTNAEDVDALELLANGDILISTFGAVSVTGVSGEDKDLLRFVPTALGDVTSGTFSMYFDGSDVGLTTNAEDIDAAALDASGAIHLSTFNNFAVSGVSGADEDVFVFTPTSLGDTTAGTYSSTLYFDGSGHGLSANDVLAIDLP
ncbi:MAG TPA: cadherin domain-containing protein [Gaiellaceae bacterium]|nr:cadherin domain-containing protein [Gaiellaceae bacterium]